MIPEVKLQCYVLRELLCQAASETGMCKSSVIRSNMTTAIITNSRLIIVPGRLMAKSQGKNKRIKLKANSRTCDLKTLH